MLVIGGAIKRKGKRNTVEIEPFLANIENTGVTEKTD